MAAFMARVAVQGDVLRKARQDRGLSLEAVAHAANLSWLTVQRAETGGTATQSIHTIDALAIALGIPVSRIIDNQWVMRRREALSARTLRASRKRAEARAMAAATREGVIAS